MGRMGQTAPNLHSIWYKFRFRAAVRSPFTILRTAGIPRDPCAPRRMEEPWTGFHLVVDVRWQETRRDGRAAPSLGTKMKKKKKEIFLVLYYCDVD